MQQTHLQISGVYRMHTEGQVNDTGYRVSWCYRRDGGAWTEYWDRHRRGPCRKAHKETCESPRSTSFSVLFSLHFQFTGFHSCCLLNATLRIFSLLLHLLSETFYCWVTYMMQKNARKRSPSPSPSSASSYSSVSSSTTETEESESRSSSRSSRRKKSKKKSKAKRKSKKRKVRLT